MLRPHLHAARRLGANGAFICAFDGVLTAVRHETQLQRYPGYPGYPFLSTVRGLDFNGGIAHPQATGLWRQGHP